jgi:hypothetical protein
MWRKKMFLLIIISISVISSMKGQSLSAEVSAMESCWYISGSLGLPVTKNGKFGFSSAVRGGSDYHDGSFNFLSISSFSYNLGRTTKATLGGVFSTFGGFVPSAGLQYFDTKRNVTWMASPMVCGLEKPQMMTLGMIQYTKSMTGKTGLVVKAITMDMFNFNEHFFSTARFRFGLKHKRIQYGIGFDLDFYGSAFDQNHHEGVFFQYQFF